MAANGTGTVSLGIPSSSILSMPFSTGTVCVITDSFIVSNMVSGNSKHRARYNFLMRDKDNLLECVCVCVCVCGCVCVCVSVCQSGR